MKKLLCNLFCLLTIVLLTSCGSSPHPQMNTVKAVIKTSELTADKNIAGIELKITLPAGVTPTFLPNREVDPVSTVIISSPVPANQKLPAAVFTSATATAPAQLEIFAIDAAGFTKDDTITISLNVAEGKTPILADFKLLSFVARDIDGAVVTGLTPTLTIQ